MPACAQGQEVDFYLVAWLEAALGPARTREIARAGGFEGPQLRGLAGLDVLVHQQADVGIGPLQLFDRAGHRRRMVRIEHGEGVVGHGRRGGQGEDGGGPGRGEF